MTAPEPPPEFRLASVFDHADPVTGPGFATDHPVIEDPELHALLLQRLAAGTPVLATPALMDDVLDASRVAEVPLTFRTDGQWVWTDAVTYYLDHYALAPDPELLAHLGDPGYTAPGPLGQDVVERAAAFVLTPAPEGTAVHPLG